jgi:predicted kinase
MIIIVIGLPGTGKTTFSRGLAERLGALHLNTDIIRDQLDLRGQYDRKTKSLIYNTMRDKAAEALQKEQSVILDGTFYKKKLRRDYINFAKKQNSAIKWIELKATETAIKERVKQKRKYSEADFSVYQKIKAAFEPMQQDCLELRNDKNTPIETLVEQALSYLEAGKA